ncbi:MAG: CoA ester lyase [Xanthobacteraceae bacterium]
MRSLLFVPADSARKLEKSLTSGADAVIVDLEDAIAPEQKLTARASAAAFLKETAAARARPRLFVRINGLESGLTDADLDAVLPAKPDAVVLPKAEGGASIIHLDAKLTAREAIFGLPDGGTGIFAFAIESATALFLAGSYAGASMRLIGLTWGSEDLSFAFAAESSRGADGNFLDPYRLARTLCLAASAAAQVPAIDTVYADFRNTEGLRREAEDAAHLGFAGKMAIHPAQIPVINEAFAPTEKQLAWARAVAAAFAAAPDKGAVAVDGVMYDRPHLLRAGQLLARSLGR